MRISTRSRAAIFATFAQTFAPFAVKQTVKRREREDNRTKQRNADRKFDI